MTRFRFSEIFSGTLNFSVDQKVQNCVDGTHLVVLTYLIVEVPKFGCVIRSDLGIDRLYGLLPIEFLTHHNRWSLSRRYSTVSGDPIDLLLFLLLL